MLADEPLDPADLTGSVALAGREFHSRFEPELRLAPAAALDVNMPCSSQSFMTMKNL